jgi:hypothetical protein
VPAGFWPEGSVPLGLPVGVALGGAVGVAVPVGVAVGVPEGVAVGVPVAVPDGDPQGFGCPACLCAARRIGSAVLPCAIARLIMAVISP